MRLRNINMNNLGLVKGGGSMNKDQRTFEEMYLGVWEPKYPSLEELDEMISYVESTEGLSKSEIRMRTKELRKIRKKVYGGDRLYDCPVRG